MNPTESARKSAGVRGQPETANSADVQAVVLETVKLWRKHHLSYFDLGRLRD